MPLAVKYGIPLLVFYKLNPVKMERYLPFFTEQMSQRHKELSDTGWVNGLYVSKAIGSCFAKNAKYPEEPLELWVSGDISEETEAFTDADRFAGFAAIFNRTKFG